MQTFDKRERLNLMLESGNPWTKKKTIILLFADSDTEEKKYSSKTTAIHVFQPVEGLLPRTSGEQNRPSNIRPDPWIRSSYPCVWPDSGRFNCSTSKETITVIAEFYSSVKLVWNYVKHLKFLNHFYAMQFFAFYYETSVRFFAYKSFNNFITEKAIQNL